MSRDWEGVHTCHAECPCQTGGEPRPDFLPVEGAIPFLGWFGYLEHLAEEAERLRPGLRGDKDHDAR